MIEQIDIYGNTKLEKTLKRIKTFEPSEGYYLAFGGGKDSVAIKALCDMAGVKYDAHYNVTSVDPPELVQFIKEQHPDVKREIPHDKDGKPITMWNLIAKRKMPPTRMVRYCCDKLKEGGGEGRTVITGVRWAESMRRTALRSGLEIETGTKWREHADPDNPENEKLMRICPTKGKHILNPIIDWTDGEVWEFIRRFNIPYCKLYDEGYKRLGCIGCPMSVHAPKELERYPKYRDHYLKAFDKMLKNLDEKSTWKTAEDVIEWWLKR